MKDPRDIQHKDFFNQSDQESRIKFLLQYAILAPSTHNSQPWLFKIEQSKCKIYFDRNLLIPKGDPTTRDLHISIGCATENLFIAGSYFSMNPQVQFGPFGEDGLLAEVTFTAPGGVVNKKWELLLDTTLTRINARGFFKNEKISQDVLESISAQVKSESYDNRAHLHFVTEEQKRMRLARLTSDGLQLAYKDPEFRKEMSGWMNNSLSFKKQGLHGYALKMPLLLSFVLPSLVKRKDIGPFLADKNYKSVSSAPLINVITAEKNGPLEWLETGRLAERLMLEFNSRGLNTSIFVASVEMGELYKQVQEVVQTSEIPQFLFVAGKVDSLHKFTPRYSVSEKVIK